MTVVKTWEDLRRLLRDNPEMYQAASDYIHQLEEQRIRAEDEKENADEDQTIQESEHA